jgi:hypothetical protein
LNQAQPKLITEQSLTDALAERVLGWKAVPDRYIKSARSWLPKWRFQPFVRVEDAFQLLEAGASSYRIEACGPGTFTAEIRIGSDTGKATDRSPARMLQAG